MKINKVKWKTKLIDFEKKHPFIPFLGTASFIVIMIVLIAGLYYIKQESIYSQQPVEFVDKEFKRVIQKELKKQEIYQQDLDSITVLEIEGNYNIENIEDIGKCRNLKKLSIKDCSVTDISIIGKLDYIQYVNLKGNNIYDLSGLIESVTLTEIILDNNYISDIEPLGHIVQLESLSIANNNISSLPDDLKNLDKLFYLNISENRLIDITNLNGLNSLVELNVAGNKLSSSPQMKNLSQLQNLNLSNNAFIELDTLGNLPQIEELYISRNYLSSLEFLEQYPQIKKVDLSYNEFSSLDGILQCKELEYLNIRGTKIEDVSCLKELENFNSIYVDENFDREQLIFMADHFRDCDNRTKEFLLKHKYNLS